MSIVKRKMVHEKMLFRKQLSKPFKQIAELMPEGFSDDDFYQLFKECYAFLWYDIIRFCNECCESDKRRKNKGKTNIYNISSPDRYLQYNAKVYICGIRDRYKKGREALCVEERIRIIDELKRKNNNKIQKRKAKAQQQILFKQVVKPSYMNYFIHEYFSLRKKHPEDINSRYLIVCEAAKFKCKASIEFLHKINACDKNIFLKNSAFCLLQGMGENVRLARNRKGKKTKTMLMEPTINNTPNELLKEIYNSQLEQHKEFDVFLSHSSYDEDELIRLKAMLNSLNFSVYVDWINDRDKLKRELTSEATANVIIERLNQCKALLYVLTENCLNSKWSPWELGYFTALKRKICIYVPNKIKTEIPPYFDIYPRLIIKDNEFKVDDNGVLEELKNWI